MAKDPLFVKSKVKDFLKGKGCMTSSDLLDGNKLNDAFGEILSDGCRRAKANNRKIVQPKDI